VKDRDATQSAGRPPISLRISVTDRCRLRCVHCSPAEGVERFAPGDVLTYEEIVRLVRIIQSQYHISKVHITGGEPLGRRGLATLVRMLADLGVEDLALTTNGQRLRAMAASLKRAGLGRVNISLPTLDAAAFRRLTGGGSLVRTIGGIDAALAAGLAPVKCNTTVLRGENDGEVADLAAWGLARGVTMRFIEVMPIGPAAARHGEWFVPSEETLGRLRSRLTLEPLPHRPGTSASEFRATDAAGKSGVVGVISPCSRPFCGECRRLRVTAGGELIGCLARPSRESATAILRASASSSAEPAGAAEILKMVREVLRLKRGDDEFAGEFCMLRTGG